MNPGKQKTSVEPPAKALPRAAAKNRLPPSENRKRLPLQRGEPFGKRGQVRTKRRPFDMARSCRKIRAGARSGRHAVRVSRFSSKKGRSRRKAFGRKAPGGFRATHCQRVGSLSKCLNAETEGYKKSSWEGSFFCSRNRTNRFAPIACRRTKGLRPPAGCPFGSAE